MAPPWKSLQVPLFVASLSALGVLNLILDVCLLGRLYNNEESYWSYLLIAVVVAALISAFTRTEYTQYRPSRFSKELILDVCLRGGPSWLHWTFGRLSRIKDQRLSADWLTIAKYPLAQQCLAPTAESCDQLAVLSMLANRAVIEALLGVLPCLIVKVFAAVHIAQQDEPIGLVLVSIGVSLLVFCGKVGIAFAGSTSELKLLLFKISCIVFDLSSMMFSATFLLPLANVQHDTSHETAADAVDRLVLLANIANHSLGGATVAVVVLLITLVIGVCVSDFLVRRDRKDAHITELLAVVTSIVIAYVPLAVGIETVRSLFIVFFLYQLEVGRSWRFPVFSLARQFLSGADEEEWRARVCRLQEQCVEKEVSSDVRQHGSRSPHLSPSPTPGTDSSAQRTDLYAFFRERLATVFTPRNRFSVHPLHHSWFVVLCAIVGLIVALRSFMNCFVPLMCLTIVTFDGGAIDSVSVLFLGIHFVSGLVLLGFASYVFRFMRDAVVLWVLADSSRHDLPDDDNIAACVDDYLRPTPLQVCLAGIHDGNSNNSAGVLLPHDVVHRLGTFLATHDVNVSTLTLKEVASMKQL